MKLRRYIFQIRRIRHNTSGVHTSTHVGTIFKGLVDRRLTHVYGHRAGHDMRGRHNPASKGSYKQYRNIITPERLERFRFFIYLGWFFQKPLTKKFYISCLTPTGRTFYLPLTTGCSIFTLTPLGFFGALASALGVLPTANVTLLETVWNIRNFTRICYVAVMKGARITLAKACGTAVCLLSYRRTYSKHLITTRLPSGQLKYIYTGNVVLLGTILPEKDYLFKNTKAGYWRNLGKRPHVRGTAMNPVDHPHGGRQKAVRWPRTPWGHSAK